MGRLQVTYRSNPDYHEGRPEGPRLFATIDLGRYGADETVSDLPIFFRRLRQPIGPMREIYSTAVAGLPVEKGNLSSLEKTLDLYLGAIVHFGRLPCYLFSVGDRAWPIYTLPDGIVTRYPGSPVFTASSIGRLRIALADYFKYWGYIRNRKELTLLALSGADLQPYLPICLFRAPRTADIPAFPAAGNKLVAPANGGRLSVPLRGPQALIRLHQAVGFYLKSKGRVDDLSQVTARKLSADLWQALQAELEPLESSLAYYDHVDGRLERNEVPIFASTQSGPEGRLLVAARTNRLGRTALYLAPTVEELQKRLGEELHKEDKLSSPHYVSVRRAPAADPKPLLSVPIQIGAY